MNTKILINSVTHAATLLTPQTAMEVCRYDRGIIAQENIDAYFEALAFGGINPTGWTLEELLQDFRAWAEDDIEDLELPQPGFYRCIKTVILEGEVYFTEGELYQAMLGATPSGTICLRFLSDKAEPHLADGDWLNEHFEPVDPHLELAAQMFMDELKPGDDQGSQWEDYGFKLGDFR